MNEINTREKKLKKAAFFFFLAFALLSLIHIVLCTAEGFEAEKESLWTARACTKVFLIPLLTLFCIFYMASLSFSKKERILLSTAFLLHTAGDIFMLWPEKEIFFMAGLASFLAGHVFILILIWKHSFKSVKIWVWALYIALYAVFITFMLRYFNLDNLVMNIAIPIYGFILLTVAFAGLGQMIGKVSPYSAFIFAGGLTFMFSDMMIAINNFIYKNTMPFHDLIIMFTYITGDFMIAWGSINTLQSLKAVKSE